MNFNVLNILGLPLVVYAGLLLFEALKVKGTNSVYQDIEDIMIKIEESEINLKKLFSKVQYEEGDTHYAVSDILKIYNALIKIRIISFIPIILIFFILLFSCGVKIFNENISIESMCTVLAIVTLVFEAIIIAIKMCYGVPHFLKISHKKYKDISVLSILLCTYTYKLK